MMKTSMTELVETLEYDLYQLEKRINNEANIHRLSEHKNVVFALLEGARRAGLLGVRYAFHRHLTSLPFASTSAMDRAAAEWRLEKLQEYSRSVLELDT